MYFPQTDHVSHPYKTSGNVIVLYTLSSASSKVYGMVSLQTEQ